MHLLLIHFLLLFYFRIRLSLWNKWWLLSDLRLFLHFFFFFVFEHTLNLSLLGFVICLFLFLNCVDFDLDFLVEFLQFLIDLTFHDDVTLGMGSLGVLPDLLDLLIIRCVLPAVLLAKGLGHPVVGLPESSGPDRLMLIIEDTLALIDHDVPILDLELAKSNIQPRLHFQLLAGVGVLERVLLAHDAEHLEILGRCLFKLLRFVFGGSLILDLLCLVVVVFAVAGHVRAIRRRRCSSVTAHWRLWRHATHARHATRHAHVARLGLRHICNIFELTVSHIAHLRSHHPQLLWRDVGEHWIKSLAPVNMRLQLLIIHILKHLRLLSHHVAVHIHIREHLSSFSLAFIQLFLFLSNLYNL